MNAGCIILSGGKSSRMGTNKALLTFNEKPNIERIRDELQKISDDIILVTNEPEAYQFLQLRTVSDVYPGKGPLSGIHAGLKHSVKNLNLVVACDMPFVSSDLGSFLLQKAAGYDAVVPKINGRQQPLFAVYTKRMFSEFEKCIVGNNLSIMHVLDSFHVLFITEEELQEHCPESMERIFFNMNHVEEYEDAKKWAETGE